MKSEHNSEHCGKDTVRIQIRLTPDCLERLNDYAMAHNLTKSGVIQVALTQYWNQEICMQNVPALLTALQHFSNPEQQLDFTEEKRVNG